jgi:hypothetical protein
MAVKSAEPLVAFYQGDRWHFWDSEGRELFNNKKILDVNGFSEGLFTVVADINGKIKNCYMDLQGKITIITDYHDAKDFSGGKALVSIDYPEEFIDKRYGFINKDGSVFIKPSLIDATFFKEGLAYIYDENRRGYIDTNGVMKISLEDGEVGYPFSEGLASVSNKQYKVAFINKTGKKVLPFDYQEPAYFVGGIAKANIDGVVGLMDKTGKLIVEPIFHELNKFYEGYSFAGKLTTGMKYNWALIDSTGQKITQEVFTDVQYFSNGLCAVKENDEWKFIDRTGKTVISNNYLLCGVFAGKKPMAWVSYKKDGQKHAEFIDTKGNTILRLPFNVVKAIDLRVNKELY